jgi:hypothetical protein
MPIEDVQAWRARWREVEQAEIAELRCLPAELKLRQLDALARSASLFDWSADDAEDERIRDMWTTLRRRMGIP